MKKKYFAVVLFIAAILTVSLVYALDITLGFTAVADDGNDPSSGPATRYDLRYSNTPIIETNFDNAIKLETGVPKAPGQLEMYTFNIPDADTHYYFAIKVFDEQDNSSQMSNLAEADLFRPAAVGDLKLQR
ncbi:MAG: hypothetical protein PHY56_01020 [Candidatus Omnitrophica bacterium]|jgi:hypothetical protein|nr:hypothetical protein [Candidatus Omnitrophota bacterium]